LIAIKEDGVAGHPRSGQVISNGDDWNRVPLVGVLISRHVWTIRQTGRQTADCRMDASAQHKRLR
jgi:hypothetical protein